MSSGKWEEIPEVGEASLQQKTDPPDKMSLSSWCMFPWLSLSLSVKVEHLSQ